MASTKGRDVVGPARPQAAQPHYSDDVGSGEIRQDIRETRADMDETLDALSERLRPRHLLDDLLDWFRGGDGNQGQTAQQIGRKVARQIKQHPVPAALISAGVVWLLTEDNDDDLRGHRYERGYMRSKEPPMHAGSYVDARTGEPYDESYGDEWRGREHAPSGAEGPGMMDKAKELSGKAMHAARGAAESIGHAASSAQHAVSSGMRHARDRAMEYRDRAGSQFSSSSHALRDRTSGMSARMQEGYRSTRDTVWQTAEDYPLAFGAAAMGLGLIVGLAVPETKTEDELMGEASDELKHRAMAAGQQVLEEGKAAAQHTMEAVSDEAVKQGLTPDELARKAQHVASDVAAAAQQSSREEGLSPAELKEKAKHVADRATSTAKQEAKQVAGHASETVKKEAQKR